MRDPLSADILREIDALPSAWDQSVVLQTLAYAFPCVAARAEWMERIEELIDAMHLTDAEIDRLHRLARGAADSLDWECEAWIYRLSCRCNPLTRPPPAAPPEPRDPRHSARPSGPRR